MLFNSYEFIFLFFPLCALGFFLCARVFTLDTALGFLVFASLGFYAYWKPAYLILLLFSIAFNFAIGQVLSRDNYWRRRSVLIFGISVNLALLGYFKYANFFVDNVNTVFGTHWDVGTIFLPLAISFFTFQQISYLVDAWQGKTHEYNFLHYALFVCFFPQLIAGPIVHHRAIIPQFMKPENLTPRWSNFAVGISIFAIGLFKKTVTTFPPTSGRSMTPVPSAVTSIFSGPGEARWPIRSSCILISPVIPIWRSVPHGCSVCVCR